MKIINNISKNVIIGIAITALIGGFLLGIFNKKDSSEQEGKNNNEPNEVIDYTNENRNEESNKEKKEAVNEEDESTENDLIEIDEDHGNLDEILVEQKVDESKLPSSYKELLGEKEAKETKKLTKDFIKIFYNLDGKYPDRYIKKIEEYVTDDLYDELIENPESPTHYEFNRKYISSEITESKNLDSINFDEMIPYIVHINGEVEDVEGKNKEETNDVYTIFISETEDKKYKVNNVYKNVYFQ